MQAPLGTFKYRLPDGASLEVVIVRLDSGQVVARAAWELEPLKGKPK